jgi:hypothetical protein
VSAGHILKASTTTAHRVNAKNSFTEVVTATRTDLKLLKNAKKLVRNKIELTRAAILDFRCQLSAFFIYFFKFEALI